ncbi:MAG: class 1 fructose-bisphosphatase [Gammaproteobacteria bacterium]|nr:MAG: class 1 fructose-bisphosphatase [Gammaproteobacteria bacterium]
MPAGPSLKEFLATAHDNGTIPGDLEQLLAETVTACKIIGYNVQRGGLLDVLGAEGHVNVQGEEQKKLDVITNDILIEHMQQTNLLAGMASEEMQDCLPAPEGEPKGRYLLVFDPLDGSSNIDINMSVGTIFSVLPAPKKTTPIVNEDFLQPGTAQVAAGFCLFGPATMLVLSFGHGTHCFTLDPDSEEFMLIDPAMAVPKETQEYAINASNQRHWHAPVQHYISDLLEGVEGPRGKNFNLRWIASMVAEIYRVLCRGGIFMYPRDNRNPGSKGRLRLMYEANPMAMIVENAGGTASTGHGRIMDIQPEGLHERVAVFMGSRHEVEYVEGYHKGYSEEGVAKI